MNEMFFYGWMNLENRIESTKFFNKKLILNQKSANN